MLLAAKNLIAKTPGGDLMFFESAYYHVFKKHVNLSSDLIAWRTQARLPNYVIKYIQYIEELDSEGSHGF